MLRAHSNSGTSRGWKIYNKIVMTLSVFEHFTCCVALISYKYTVFKGLGAGGPAYNGTYCNEYDSTESDVYRISVQDRQNECE